jgi:hypothetical protein
MLPHIRLVAPGAFLAARKHGVMRRLFNTFLHKVLSEGLLVPGWSYRRFVTPINSIGQPITCRQRVILRIGGLVLREAQQLAPCLLKIILCVIVAVPPIDDSELFGAPNHHSFGHGIEPKTGS